MSEAEVTGERQLYNDQSSGNYSGQSLFPLHWCRLKIMKRPTCVNPTINYTTTCTLTSSHQYNEGVFHCLHARP